MKKQQWTRLPIYVLLIALLSGCTAPWRKEPTATVVIQPDAPGVVVPARFLGFSFEARELTDPQIDARNVALVQMLSLLGPGVLRFGGNSVERTFWNAAPPNTGTMQQYTVTRADLERVFGFARQVGWQVILGVNLRAGTPEQAADEIAAAAAVGGPLLLGVEIGNEPDLYKPQWSVDQYCDAFNTFATAIHARAPQVAFVGPGSAWGHWVEPFVAASGSQIALATYHYYPLHRNAGRAEDDPTFPTVEHLLAPAMMKQTAYDVHSNVMAAQQAGLPLRIDETNSVSGGGASGVSDVFAAALWMAQYLFTAAQQGAAGVNVHGGLNTSGQPYYSLLHAQADSPEATPRYAAAPPFYGMLLFHEGAVGRFVQTTLTATDALTSTARTLAAFATRADDGTLRVTLINVDAAHEHYVDVQLGAFYRESGMVRLLAPSPTVGSDITLGETPVRADGSWKAKPSATSYLNSTHMDVPVPAASAVVLTFTP